MVNRCATAIYAKKGGFICQKRIICFLCQSQIKLCCLILFFFFLLFIAVLLVHNGIIVRFVYTDQQLQIFSLPFQYLYSSFSFYCFSQYCFFCCINFIIVLFHNLFLFFLVTIRGTLNVEAYHAVINVISLRGIIMFYFIFCAII